MLKTFQFRIQKSVSDSDFLFTFNVYHMDDKNESDLVMVSNQPNLPEMFTGWSSTRFVFLVLI
jgi:hypothetical protein